MSMQPERTVHYESYFKKGIDPVPRFDYWEVPAIDWNKNPWFGIESLSFGTLLTDHIRDWDQFCIPHAVASTSVYFDSTQVRNDMLEIIRTAAKDKIIPTFSYYVDDGSTVAAAILGVRVHEEDGLFLVLRMPLAPPSQYHRVG